MTPRPALSMEATPLSPGLPQPRGPLSTAVVRALEDGDERGGAGSARGGGEPGGAFPGLSTATADPYGDDLHLALYVLYELHYRGFAGTAADREWDPSLLRLRGALERRFHDALRTDAPVRGDARAALDALLAEPAGHDEGSVSHVLARRGTVDLLREYAAVRSLYHLKEADPHAWVIPRLRGRAKAAMVAVEYDEFGAGRGQDVHAQLFADLMTDLGLDTAYGRYVDAAPAEMLALVNFMSLCGLHRALRGALVGHFATVEVTSSPASRRLARAMRRAGAGPAAERFYDEHVAADAVHEQVVRHEVVGGLLADEPELDGDVEFGVAATVLLERRLGARMLSAWAAGGSVLRTTPGGAPGAAARVDGAGSRDGEEPRRGATS